MLFDININASVYSRNDITLLQLMSLLSCLPWCCWRPAATDGVPAVGGVPAVAGVPAVGRILRGLIE